MLKSMALPRQGLLPDGLWALSRSGGVAGGATRNSARLGICQKMLSEAGIPAKYLAPADLLKLDESGRKREIAKVTAQARDLGLQIRHIAVVNGGVAAVGHTASPG